MPRCKQCLNDACRFVMLSITCFQFLSCQQKPDAPIPNSSTKAEYKYNGEMLYRVRLTAKRAEEFGIKTARVRKEQRAGKLQKVIPVAAVVYDQHGDTWTFKSPDSLVFVRERINVDAIDGDLAVLANGPAVGTAVVTAGAARLFSDEFSENKEGMAESNVSEVGTGKKYVGIATMKEGGAIKVVYKTAGAAGLGASIVIEYKPQDEDYQKILDRVGGLKIGETKSVPPQPESMDKH